MELAKNGLRCQRPGGLRGDGPGVYEKEDMEERYLLEELQGHPQVSVISLNSPSSVGKERVVKSFSLFHLVIL